MSSTVMPLILWTKNTCMLIHELSSVLAKHKSDYPNKQQMLLKKFEQTQSKAKLQLFQF